MSCIAQAPAQPMCSGFQPREATPTSECLSTLSGPPLLESLRWSPITSTWLRSPFALSLMAGTTHNPAASFHECSVDPGHPNLGACCLSVLGLHVCYFTESVTAYVVQDLAPCTCHQCTSDHTAGLTAGAATIPSLGDCSSWTKVALKSVTILSRFKIIGNSSSRL